MSGSIASNALQRVEELKSLGQYETAFNLLHETVANRRFRYINVDHRVQLQVMNEYCRLAIDFDYVKNTRDGLMQFRNHCQHTLLSVQPMADVVLNMTGYAEKKLEDLLNKAEELGMKESLLAEDAHDYNVGDVYLDQMLGSTDTSFQSLKTDFRRIVRLVVEVYRTCADIIKTTPQLPTLYHTILQKGFAFCHKYNLKTGFRRLCDMTASHYASILKQKPKHNLDPAAKHDVQALKNPELHIATRLVQLQYAAELEFWNQAQQCIEDLHHMGILELAAKRMLSGHKSNSAAALQSRQFLVSALSTYYEKLSEVFLKSGLQAHHALVYLKWFVHVRNHQKKLAPETKQALATLGILVVLATPVVAENDGMAAAAGTGTSAARLEEKRRLINLAGHPVVPSRAALVTLLRDRGVTDAAHPAARQLIAFVEGENDFLPFSIQSRVMPLLKEITTHLKDLPDDSVFAAVSSRLSAPGALHTFAESFMDSVKKSIFRRVVFKLAEVYETIGIDSFVHRVCPQEYMPWSLCEVQLAEMQKELGLDVKVDHLNKTLRLRAVADDHMGFAQRLSSLSCGLLSVILNMRQEQPAQKQKLESHLQALKARIPLDRAAEADRFALLQTANKELELQKQKINQDLAELNRERTQKQLEDEKRKQAELAQLMEQKRLKEESEAARVTCAQMVLKKINEVLKHIEVSPQSFQLAGTPLSQFTPETLLLRKIAYKDLDWALTERIQQLRNDQLKANRAEFKRFDYQARTMRLLKAERLDIIGKEQESRAQEIREQIAAAKEKLAARRELLAQKKHIIEEWAAKQQWSKNEEPAEEDPNLATDA